MKPFYYGAGHEWRMRVHLTIEMIDKLSPIPGLGLTYDQHIIRGKVDAIAAACMVLKVPPPDTIYQDGMGITTTLPLKDYQHEGVVTLAEILKDTGGALLADDMGLGKSLQTIALANTMNCSRILIVAPRFMSMGWIDELNKWGEGESIAYLQGGDSKKAKLNWHNGQIAKWVITSYEMLAKAAEACFNNGPPDFLVFDEAHMIKNVFAGRSQVAKDMANMVPYKLALTATPMWNRPKDFYGILRVLLGNRFGSRTAFYTRYCGGFINAHQGLEAKGSSNEEELKKRLSYYMVRREKKDVLKELPSLTRQVIWLDADREGEKALKAAVLNKRANATYEAVKATADAKVEAAVELAIQAKQFVLFTYERKHAEEIASKIDKRGGQVVCIHGGLTVEKRQSLIQAAASLRGGIVATIDSLGAGVNLQGVAHVGIMHTLDWVPLKMAQAEARIHRLGQTNPVLWYYLACRETMDEIVVRNIVGKLDQWRSILGAESNRGLRDSLGATIGGHTEEEALAAIYEELKG